MNKLMKVLAVSAIMLMATGAFAVELISVDKVAPVKADATVTERGFIDCSGAVDVSAGGIFYGDNTGMPNNVGVYTGCDNTWDESGGEVVFVGTFGDDVTWSAGIAGDFGDVDLIILDQCDEDLGCLGVFDSGAGVSSPFAGTFYFIVDGYGGAATTFTFEMTITPYVPPVVAPFCDFLMDTGEQTVGTFTGNTCDGMNLVSSLDCGAYTENGFEHYYEVKVPAGATFTVDLMHTVDSAIWLLDACDETYACIGYADDYYPEGNEYLEYTAGATDEVVYLVIDSYGDDTCGDYSFEFTSTGGAVATEAINLGGMKALYR